MLNGNARAMAIYNAVASQPSFAKLNSAEQNTFLTQLKTLFGADTTYLTGNAVITPGTFAVPSGVAVATSGSAAAQAGATTAPGSVGGNGNLT